MEQDSNRLNELFNVARNEPPTVSFEETKQQFLSSLKAINSSSSFTKVIRQFLTFKKLIIMALTLSTIAIGTFLLMNTSNTTIKNKTQVAAKEFKSDTVLIIEKNAKIKQKDIEQITPLNVNFSEKLGANTKQVKLQQLKKLKAMKNVLVYQQKKITIDTAYRFPNLTPKEIVANNKLKAKMIKVFAKKTVFGYVWIPQHENAFEIKQTEVTNLQYRVFLFDLLIHDRKQDFLIAKPDQSQWQKIGEPYGKIMQENYFSSQKYFDYPVVNISRKGAEMYCKWLANEINQSKQKKLKGLLVAVRLPTVKEWKYAASGGKNYCYGWNLNILQNNLGCFLANFRYSPKIDTIKFTGCDVKYPKAYTTSGLLLGNNNFTVKVTSYNANDFHLFCISGNVAEMVNYANGTIGAKGGSWNSLGENLKINAPDEFKGIASPNVNIGFRPIITLLKK